MAKKVYSLHLMHASLHLALGDGATAADIAYTIAQAPDMCTYTETAGRGQLFRNVAEARGYRAVAMDGNPGEKFVYNPDTVRLKDQGAIQCNAAQGSDPARYINWIRVGFHGEDVWYHTGHWLPNPAKYPGRIPRHNAMSNQMAAQVRKHGAGDGISFFSGDINSDDQSYPSVNYNQIMRSNGLLSVWDENLVYPSTYGSSTIDVIGRYTPDKQVKNTRYKVWPRQNSDHKFISAWYDITTSQVSVAGGDSSPTPADAGGGGASEGGVTVATTPEPADPDFYVTGGNISWSEYDDATLFHLEQAVDDSAPDHGNLISD